MAADAKLNGDIDPLETREWVDSLDAVLEIEGPDRRASSSSSWWSARPGRRRPAVRANTAYVNTIPLAAGRRPATTIWNGACCFMRWNAMAMVVRANKDSNVGGHIASFASAATLYDVGLQSFLARAADDHGGDLVYFQGHSRPASTRAPSSKAASAKSSWTISARKSTATACRPTRTPG